MGREIRPEVTHPHQKKVADSKEISASFPGPERQTSGNLWKPLGRREVWVE